MRCMDQVQTEVPGPRGRRALYELSSSSFSIQPSFQPSYWIFPRSADDRLLKSPDGDHKCPRSIAKAEGG